MCVFNGRKEFPWVLRNQIGCHGFCGLEVFAIHNFLHVRDQLSIFFFLLRYH